MTPKNIISNYQIKRLIGQGGMGKVYLAHHTKIDRKVAIKELHPQFTKDKSIRERFKNEAALMANLSHPNIVTLHDYIENPENVYLILEYVEGTPLDYYLEHISGPIPEEKAIEMFIKILDAFEYAHQRNIIHRDIKPSNIMVTNEGEIKILDFGIAKLANAVENPQTKQGVKIGTIYYMSPEQVLAKELDTRSDIYALGITLFEMLTAHNPYFQFKSEYEISHKIVHEPLPRAKTFYPNVSEYIQQVIDQATAKNPDNRFQSAKEFKETLLNRKDIQLKQSSKGITVEWNLQTKQVETKTKEIISNTTQSQNIPLLKREREVFVFENEYGSITNRRVMYMRGRDLFEKGNKEELYLRKILSADLKGSREIGSGIVFLMLALPLPFLYLSIITLLLSFILLLFALVCFLVFPKIIIIRADSKKIKMRGWPWHTRRASEFVWHLKDELKRISINQPKI